MRKEIKINNICNQNCIFCDSGDFDRKLITSNKRIMDTIYNWAKDGVKELMFNGMEPTLDKNLPTYIKIAKNCGYETIRLATNGVKLENIHYVKRLKEVGLNQVLISLHSHIPEISDFLTSAPGTFSKTLKGIEESINAGFSPEISFVINSVNFKQVLCFLIFINDNFGENIGRIVISFVAPLYKAWKNKKIIPKIILVIPYLKEAINYAKNENMKVIIYEFCGIPICFLKEYKEFCEEYLISEKREAGEKMKLVICKYCKYDSICSGIFKKYIELYGIEEIIPQN